MRQKHDQACFGGCNTSIDERRPRTRKLWYGKCVHRYRGANRPRRTRNKKERLDPAARRSNEFWDDKHQSESRREKLYTACECTSVSKKSEGVPKVTRELGVGTALVQRVVVTDDRRHAAEELASRWTQLRPEEILQSPYVLIGTVDQIAEDLQAHRERWGISYYVIFEPYIDAFAPVVARLAQQ